MATEKTVTDGLGVYLTTTSSHVENCAPDSSLGGFISTSQVQPYYTLIGTDIPEIVVEQTFGANGSGTQGVIHADSSTSLTYTAPGGTGAGASVTIADGDTVLLLEKAGDGIDKAVRVTRDGSDNLGDRSPDGMTLDYVESFNSAIAMNNVTDAQRVAGLTTYRGLMLSSHGLNNLTNVKVWQDSGNPSTIAIAKEAPTGAIFEETIQTIASETTAPTGLSWNTGTTSGTGLQIGSMNAFTTYGLWIRRVIPAVETVSEKETVTIHCSFDIGATTYTQKLVSSYRVAEDALDRYELYVGEDADPDLTAAPDTTSTTLPFDHALTPGGGDKEFRFTVRKSNEYDLTSLNQYWRTVTIDSGGAQVTGNPTAPEALSLAEGIAGELDIEARYSPKQDEFPADKFAVYIRGDGVDPTFATSERTLFDMSGRDWQNRAAFLLSEQIGPFAKDADVRVVVRSHRSSDTTESTNTTATAITMATMRPDAPSQSLVFLGQSARQKTDPDSDTTTTTIDSGASVRYEQSPGKTDLLHGANLVMRLRYNPRDTTNNGLWTTYAFNQTTVTGSPAEDMPTSWTSPIIYLHVGDDRRMTFNTSTSVIAFDGVIQDTDQMVFLRDIAPVADGSSWHSCFQVFDNCTNNYESTVSLAENGELLMRVPWRQVSLVSEIP